MNPGIPTQGVSDIPRDKDGKPISAFVQPSTTLF
jgi:hypothetical protein